MKMDHVALVTGDAEKLVQFYVDVFGAKNVVRWEDEHVLIFFAELDNGVKIEFEHRKNPEKLEFDRENTIGLAHIAMRVGSKEELEAETERIKNLGVPMRSGPTAYGEDFYESSFWDPDGNVVEVTVDYDYLQSLKVNK